MTWFNNDGLFVKFGAEEAVVTKGGEVTNDGKNRLIEFDILWSDLAAFGTSTFLSNMVEIPTGAYIERVEFLVETAFTSGGSATLSFGGIQTDRATTTGFGVACYVAATAVASLTAGTTIVGAGANVNTKLTLPNYLTATVAVANMTAGRGKLRVFFFIQG